MEWENKACSVISVSKRLKVKDAPGWEFAVKKLKSPFFKIFSFML
jgi:hypothetical protein